MRVVLDTNTVVSALLFPKGRLCWLPARWTTGRVLPLISSETARELIRVLAYLKFALTPAHIQAVLAAYLPFSETPDRQQVSHAARVCRDSDDQIFVVLAFDGRADVLVSGDKALLEMRSVVPFTIEAPAEFRRRFE